MQLQYVRAVAALLVVFHHARNPVPWLFNPAQRIDFAVWGVDVFFVLSGFVMFIAARNVGVGTYLWRRLIRVAPLYWLATIAFLLLKGPTWRAAEISLVEVIKSFAFIPYANATYGGAAWPILAPGWTLHFEMFFYLVFALGLWLRKPVQTACALLPALVVIGLVLQPEGAIASTLTSFRLIEFVGGLGLGVAFARVPLRRYAVLLPMGVAGILATEFIEGPVEPWFVFACSLAVVGGALGLEERLKGARPIGWLKRIGDASYALYLTHTLVIIVMLRLFKRLPLEGWPQFAGFMGSVMLVSIAVGLLVHALVEKPALAALERVWTGRPSANPASVAS